MLFLDERDARGVAVRLRTLGHDAVSLHDPHDPHEAPLAGAPDAEVLVAVRLDKRALVTENVSDFRPLESATRRRLSPGRTHLHDRPTVPTWRSRNDGPADTRTRRTPTRLPKTTRPRIDCPLSFATPWGDGVHSDCPPELIGGQSAGHQSPCESVVCPTSMM